MTDGKNDAGYERSDARLKPLLAFAAGLVVLMVVAMSIVAAVESGFERSRATERNPHPLSEAREPSGAPALQADPAVELAEVRRREASLLGSYGWIDPANEVVRIPIERAMALLAERGPRPPGREGGDGR